MPWFKRADPDLFDGLAEAVGHRAAPLAFGTGKDRVLAGTRQELVLREGDSWQVWPWHTIAGGSWDGEKKTFQWRTVEGDEFQTDLEEANLLPQLFRERIEATTVVRSTINTARGRVEIVGRRTLAGTPSEEPVRFYAVPYAGADLLDEATRVAIVAETDRLRQEYF